MSMPAVLKILVRTLPYFEFNCAVMRIIPASAGPALRIQQGGIHRRF